MRIGIVAYENCTASMITGLMDILSLANTQASKKSPAFKIDILTTNGEPVNSFTGFSVASTASLRSRQSFDLIYIPGFLADPIETINNQKTVIAWIKKQFNNGTKMMAACNGNLLLAESGVLEGKAATTHWSLKTHFEKTYPTINLQVEKIIVDEGDVISAAGVTAYMNLALYVVARFQSAEAASFCSKVFLVDSGRKVQTPYLTFSTPRNHGDKEIVEVQNWIERNYQQQVTIESLMDKSTLSRRTLLRRFKNATGDSPLEYVQRVRIESAKRFLETTNKTFSEITWNVGYNDISSFQRLFKLYTRLTPREYRDKFTMVITRPAFSVSSTQ